MSEHFRVEMGPIPGLPAWHVQSQPVGYGFPTVEAATRFAQSHKAKDPQREVGIRYPDGRLWNGKEWV